MTLDDKSNLSVAGLVLGVVGSLLALVPSLERLLLVPPTWPEPLLMSLLAIGGLIGVAMAARELEHLGGLVTAILGIVIAVLGPTAPGILAVLGGALIFAAAQEAGPVAYESDDSAPAESGQGSA